MRRNNILVTGPPGCGKSTVIENVVRNLARPATGFFTREIRQQSVRKGFEVVTLDGKRGMLAHVSLEGPFRVGKYCVTLEGLERIAIPSMIPTTPDEIVVIDEIGKMECLSKLFRETLIRVLDAANPVLGSIAAKGDAFIEAIKVRQDVLMLEVSRENAHSLAQEAAKMLLSR
jgi:nucleoside-triphosphatase